MPVDTVSLKVLRGTVHFFILVDAKNVGYCGPKEVINSGTPRQRPNFLPHVCGALKKALMEAACS